MVVPDLQSHGIGGALRAAVERSDAGTVREYALFTGADSEANLRLYRRRGYRPVRTEPVTDRLVLIHLTKRA